MKKTDFLYSKKSGPHHNRAKTILAKYPHIKQLIGKNPTSIWFILVLVITQFVFAYVLSNQPWWLVVTMAYFIGAFVNHGLLCLMHDCTHQLLFKNNKADRLAGMLTNLPHLLPISVNLDHHLKHHAYQGIHELDMDIASYWEVKLISNSFFGKVFWFSVYPLFQMARITRVKNLFECFDRWLLLTCLLQITVIIIVLFLFSFKSFMFLLLSFLFSCGLHSMGGRLLQEHFVMQADQEPYSYYGVLNKIAFNIGYHYEHHDFPWNRLPKVKKIAPDFYNTLIYHTSWSKILLNFLLNKNFSLFSRMTRTIHTNDE